MNRAKRSIALDLRDEAAADVARELARRADVVIENFKPGGLAKYGLDLDSVRSANPAVVYASISGSGSGAGKNEPLPTADNDLIVAAANDGQFRKLCTVPGIPEVADGLRFARNADRRKNRDVLRPILSARLSERGADLRKWLTTPEEKDRG